MDLSIFFIAEKLLFSLVGQAGGNFTITGKYRGNQTKHVNTFAWYPNFGWLHTMKGFCIGSNVRRDFFSSSVCAPFHAYQDRHKRWMGCKNLHCLFSFLVQNTFKNTKSISPLFVRIVTGHQFNSLFAHKARNCWKK